MKYIIFLLAISFILQSSSCNKKDPLGPQVINNSIFFLLKKNNFRLQDSILNNLKLFYFSSSTKTYVSDFKRATDEGYDLGIMTTRDVGNTSGDNNIKDYFLEYPNGTKDTLYIDFKHVNYDEAKNNSCYCYYPLISLKYNGVTASLDSTITQQKVYKFNKP